MSPRPWRARLCAAGLGLLVALAVGEGIARLLVPAHAPSLVAAPDAPLTRAKADPAGLLYELIPGATVGQAIGAFGETPAREVRYAINAEGYRGTPLPPIEGEALRVLVAGDSFAFGSGVGEAETLARQLEGELAARLPNAIVAVANLGVPGYEAQQTVIALGRWIDRLAPDLVLFVLYVNDVQEPGLSRGGRPGAHRRAAGWSSSLGRVSALYRVFTRTLEARSRERAELERLEALWRADGPGWLRLETALRTLAGSARGAGCALHLAWHPRLIDVELDEDPLAQERDRLAALCAALELPLHDLRGALAGRPPETLYVHPRDHHPNATCIGLVAEQLADALAPALAGR